MEKTVETRLIAVGGAGAMGSGIAQVAATSGVQGHSLRRFGRRPREGRRLDPEESLAL